MAIDRNQAVQVHEKGLTTSVAVNNVNDTTPTKAELTTAVLAASGEVALADVPNGFVFVVNDNAGAVNCYMCVKTSVPTNELFFIKLTKSA